MTGKEGLWNSLFYTNRIIKVISQKLLRRPIFLASLFSFLNCASLKPKCKQASKSSDIHIIFRYEELRIYNICIMFYLCFFYKDTIYLFLFSFRKITCLWFKKNKNYLILNSIASSFSTYVFSVTHMCHLIGIVLVSSLVLQSGVMAKCLLSVIETEEKQ